ncbi:hypothetical protein [Paenibacillus xerothermodurans]|uniref:Uncharacterized protein n=1 Tax=Paenibacillus xerothermodurans TaxID=1977292 RepID=A0A2W1NFZ0_PAEXE|nr:hypothetical protein [Paenibacillus xerothermodurans]PZE22600.1 hypothetical protein CBW46_002160 [Paenibacillus xerothermodurans]
MPDTTIPDYESLRSELHRLFQAAGYARPELLNCIDIAERATEEREQLSTLQTENARLKQEITRLRNLYYAKDEHSMSSKLRDALRE